MSQAADHFARGDWQAAYDAWSRTGLDDLSAAELDSFGAAVELVGPHDEVVRVLQRAFRAHQQAGDLHAAAGCAFRLAMGLAEHGEHALPAGGPPGRPSSSTRSRRTAPSAAGWRSS